MWCSSRRKGPDHAAMPIDRKHPMLKHTQDFFQGIAKIQPAGTITCRVWKRLEDKRGEVDSGMDRRES